MAQLDKTATQIKVLRATLVGLGVLLDGELYEDRIGIIGYGPEVYLVLDYPDDKIEPGCQLDTLMQGVRAVVTTRDKQVAQKALHKLMVDLHQFRMWPKPCPTWQEVIVPNEALIG